MIFENRTFREPSASCPELAILFVYTFNRWVSEPHVPALGTEWSRQSPPLSVFLEPKGRGAGGMEGSEDLAPSIVQPAVIMVEGKRVDGSEG